MYVCMYVYIYTYIYTYTLWLFKRTGKSRCSFFKVNHQKTKGYIPTDIPQFYRDISTADPWLTLLQTNSMDVE